MPNWNCCFCQKCVHTSKEFLVCTNSCCFPSSSRILPKVQIRIGNLFSAINWTYSIYEPKAHTEIKLGLNLHRQFKSVNVYCLPSKSTFLCRSCLKHCRCWLLIVCRQCAFTVLMVGKIGQIYNIYWVIKPSWLPLLKTIFEIRKKSDTWSRHSSVRWQNLMDIFFGFRGRCTPTYYLFFVVVYT